MKTDEVDSMFDSDLLAQEPDTTDDPSPDAEASESVPTDVTSADADMETPGADEPSVEPEEAPKTPETVPLATFLETKNEIKAERERNDQLNKRLDMMVDMVNRGQPAREEQAPPAEPKNEIDPDEDLVGYLKRENELLNQKMERLSENVQGAQQISQGQADQNAFIHNLGLAEDQFRRESPDYDSAVDFLRGQERQNLSFYLDQLISSGKAPQMDQAMREQTVEAQLRRNELQAAWTYQAQGINPVQAVYNLARTRGYTQAAPAEQVESPEAKRLREKTEQAQATQTLGAGGAELTPDLVRDGTNDEFEAAMKARGFG